MTLIDFTPADIPDRLPDLIGFSASCGCGRTHEVEMQGASIRDGALDDVVHWVRDIGASQRICLVADRVTLALCGEEVARLLASDAHQVKFCVLPDGAGGRPHADETTLAVVEDALLGMDLGVAVGAGTVNDLTKLASHRRHIPYVVVATAPSMNGYTSAIAAVTLQGIKRTVECHQPHAVICDLAVLKNAPAELTAAGLGDLESKPTATADYRLAGRVRGDYYCPAPERVVMNAEARVAEAAEGLRRGDPETVALLTEALLLSGISMKLAGSSSPASGGEHLISHHWDMTAPEEGRVEGWHGAQVGVATVVTATLYEHLQKLQPEAVDVDTLVDRHPTRDAMIERIRATHGPNADEVAKESMKKFVDKAQLRAEIERTLAGWGELWDSLADVLRPGSRIRAILAAAGAPTGVHGLGLSPRHLERSLGLAHEIRGRYTVLDFATALGVLPDRAGDILAASGCL